MKPNNDRRTRLPKKWKNTATVAKVPNMTFPEEEAKPTNAIALAGMIVGLASVFFFELIVPGPLAIVLSAIGLSRANTLKNSGKKPAGKGFAITGLTLGIVYTLVAFLRPFTTGN